MYERGRERDKLTFERDVRIAPSPDV